MQAHLRCEDLLPGKANAGRMDRRTSEGLKTYQHLQMLADNANLDFETRAALLGDSREQDFRALLRALRARVVDVTGLIEDGSALGAQGQVQGRVIDTNEFQPLSAPPGAAKPTPPSAAAGPNAGPPSAAAGPNTAAAATASPPPAAAAVADASTKDASVKIVPAPDLIAAATQAASDGAGLEVTGRGPREHAGRAAGRVEKARAKTGEAQGSRAAAAGRRDPPAAAAGLPQPQHGASRGDRPR